MCALKLPASANDAKKPDFGLIQTAWWTAIIKCYEHARTCPMRMPLELRIMGDSDVTMAPQKGNILGTASIEVLTLQDMSKEWHGFAQEVCDEWMKLREWKGEKLNIRPHWAKEWVNFEVDGNPFIEYLKNDCYRDEIGQFNAVLEKIGKRDGWTRRDIQKVFSNELFDEVFFEDIRGE